MTPRLIAASTFLLATVFLASCGKDADAPMLAGNTGKATTEGETLYQNAKREDDAGNSKKAAKLYDEVATRYSFAPSAPQARYRQAQLLEQLGDVQKAFEAYDQFLTRFPESGLYTTTLNHQAEMAQSAADGDVKSSFLGLKTKLSLEKTVAMLTKVKGHAPKSPTASKAQFTIGRLYEGKKKSKEAIDTYHDLVKTQPESKEAPEALFRVGVILMEDADRGNQNQANIELSRESFNDYLIQYPNHERNAEARKLIDNLGKRDLQQSYNIAEYYRKIGKFESAKVYYRDIVKHSTSGKLHDESKARLKELGE